MDRRRFLFAGLLGGVALALGAAPAAALAPATPRNPAPEPQPEAKPALAGREAAEDLLTEAQWGPPPGRGRRRGRRPRCWIERRRIVVRDRYGRPRSRWVERRVCR